MLNQVKIRQIYTRCIKNNIYGRWFM